MSRKTISAQVVYDLLPDTTRTSIENVQDVLNILEALGILNVRRVKPYNNWTGEHEHEESI